MILIRVAETLGWGWCERHSKILYKQMCVAKSEKITNAQGNRASGTDQHSETNRSPTKLCFLICLPILVGGLFATTDSFAQSQVSHLHTNVKAKDPGRVLEAGGVVWIYTSDSLYRWREDSLEKPKKIELDFGDIREIKEVGGWVWILADNGLFRCRVGPDYEPKATVVDGQQAWEIKVAGGWMWIGAENGLYRWRVGSPNEPEKVDLSIGSVSDLQETGGWLWINAEKGLYRRRVGSLDKQQKLDLDIGVYGFQEVAGWLWIDSEEGLYRWRLGSPNEPQQAIAGGSVSTRFIESGGWVWSSSVAEDRELYRSRVGSPNEPEPTGIKTFLSLEILEVDGWVWIGTEDGLFRCRVGAPDAPQEVNLNIGTVKAFQEAGKWLWIGTELGLYRWRVGSPGITTEPVVEGVSIEEIRKAGEKLWIDAGDDMYRWQVGSSKKPEPAGLETESVFDFEEIGEWLWIGTRNGLYRWRVTGEVKPELIPLTTARVSEIERVGGCLWIWTVGGLFQIKIATEGWDTAVLLTKKFPNIAYSDTPLPIAWKIEDYGRRSAADLVQCRIIVNDRNSQNPLREIVQTGVTDLTLDPLRAGDYSITVEATDLWGKVARSDPLEFHVYASTWEVFIEYLVWVASLYIITNALVFLSLVLLSRRYSFCLRLLTSRWVLFLGIYYGILLRNLPALQVWILAQCYRSVRQNLEDPIYEYVPRLLSQRESQAVLTTPLLDELRQERRIWITGGPGTGKTATVVEVLRGYFDETNSAWSGWRQFRFIPLPIRLRDTLETSLEHILVEALARHGVLFGDDNFARKFIRSAPLLCVLDGVNEARLDHQQLSTWLPEFLQISPHARILATSQSSVGAGRMLEYAMPPITADIAQQLLCALLGDEEGAAAFAAASPELWDRPDQMTAYEVVQVADLFQMKRQLPCDRTELYGATLEWATEGGTEAVSESLSRLAWDAWLTGQLQILIEVDLLERLLPNLVGPILVRRGLGAEGNDRYEIVHELMRDYLAARWAVLYATTPIARLDVEEVWQPSQSRSNAAFFTFVAELISNVKTMSLVGRFAMQDLEWRTGLLKAVLSVAHRRQWELPLSIDAHLNGVCAIVPRHQEGYRPRVIGMGILVGDHDVITCAHVVDSAIGDGWFETPGDGVVRICFPFSKGPVCVSGTVDRRGYFRADSAEEGMPTDIAVVRLHESAPASVGRANLRNHVLDTSVKVYGFPSIESMDGGWVSHPLGESLMAKITSSLVGGLVECVVTEPSNATVERGFSGAGLYYSDKDAFVGMMVMSSKDKQKPTGMFISVDHLREALAACMLREGIVDES